MLTCLKAKPLAPFGMTCHVLGINQILWYTFPLSGILSPIGERLKDGFEQSGRRGVSRRG
jgi:hypothetical protein